MKSEIDFFDLIDRHKHISNSHFKHKKVKIVCTMGPSTNDPKVLRQLIRAGMDVARLNFSHGDHAFHARMIKMLRDAAKQEGKHLGILQDIQGPKLRIGRFENGQIQLKKDQKFVITTKSCMGTEERVSCSLKSLHHEIQVGHRILLDDGLIFLHVEKIKNQDIHTRVIFGGTLKNNKGINLPDTRLSLRKITAKDKKDILFGLQHDVDFIALSFISEVNDLKQARRLLKSAKHPPSLIAKIETRLAVHNIDEIISESDGIMVARGDLGVECPIEKLPGIQKRIIRSANRAGKFVITATQMLESMVKNPRPTRAEASDVANAVLDGSDAVMLSAETASGQFPVEAVTTMSRIILRTADYEESFSDLQEHRSQDVADSVPAALAHAAVKSTSNLTASAIVAFTHTGRTAQKLSQLRPNPLVFALSPFERTCRRLSIQWGVIPALTKPMKHTDDMPKLCRDVLKKNAKWKKDDCVVMLSGTPVSKPGSANLLKIHRVTSS